jgi:hypothetical protein
MLTNIVRWADGTYDRKRTCEECGKTDCDYPVYKDFYKEKIVTKAYRNWLEGNNPDENY